MAARRYLDLITDLEALTQITNQRALVQRAVQDGVGRIATAWDWPYLWTRDFFATADDITAGDADVTNGSATVTSNHASTSWPATVVGRKFRIGSEAAYYTIRTRVSATELTLDQVYQGTTATDNTYVIFQDEYYLRADVDKYKFIRQIQTGQALTSMHPSEFDLAVPTPEAFGDPDVEMQIGRADTTYTTGTVAMTASTRTLTGTSTAWTTALGVSRGTKLRINDVIFTVDTVDSDTQITTYELATVAITAGNAYAAIIDNITVQIYDLPDAVRNLYYRFQRLPAPLNRDGDLPDLPYAIHDIILYAALPTLWHFKGQMDRVTTAEQQYQGRIAEAIAHYGHVNPDRTYPRTPYNPARGLLPIRYHLRAYA